MAIDHTSGREDANVQCRQIHAALRQRTPLSPAEQAHVAECVACSVLAGDDGTLAAALSVREETSAPALPASLSLRLQHDEDTLRGRMRGMPTAARASLAVLGALLVPLLVALTWRRGDLGVYPTGRLVWDLAAFAVPAGLALWVALRPMHRASLPRGVEPGLVLIGVAGMLALAVLPMAHHEHPASLLGVADDFIPRARGCFVTGTLAGLPVLLWVRAMLRDDGPWWAVMVLLAMTAALVGGLSVFLHCPLVSPRHLAAGHATVVVPFLVLALLGRRRV